MRSVRSCIGSLRGDLVLSGMEWSGLDWIGVFFGMVGSILLLLVILDSGVIRERISFSFSSTLVHVP